MRILLVNQFFWPDSSATSQLLTDLARGLAERGHDVYTISASSGYNLASADSPPEVHIYQVRSSGFSRGRIGRLASYLSFYIGALLRSFAIPRADLIVTLTTPPLLSLVGTLVKTLRGSRHFIWEMDVYPDVAVSLEYFKAGGWADRITGMLADYSRRKADGIIALGNCMKQLLVTRGVDPGRIFVADNWADGAAIQPYPRPEDPANLVLLYSGNFGLAHDLDTVAGAMLRLKEDPRFRFVFVGSGIRHRELASLVETYKLQFVEIRPFVERGNLGESLSVGDIGIVTQSDACCGAVVPSKVYGLLAAGRPVLFIGPKQATPASIIRRFNCGWHVACGDVLSLTNLLIHLADRPDDIAAAGRNARDALLQHYNLPIGVQRVADILGARSVGLNPSDMHPLLNVSSSWLEPR